MITLNYFGLRLKVARDIRYLAQDSNGVVYGYGFKPQLDPANGWGFIGKAPGVVQKIGKVKLNVNWHQSLKEVA